MMTKNNAVQYRQFVYRSDDGDPTTEKADYEKLAFSTMFRKEKGYDNLVEIFKIKPDNYTSAETVRHRMWLHDLLDDNGIPYLVEIASVWLGRRNHGEVQFIYVEKKDRRAAFGLIKEFKNAPQIRPGNVDDAFLLDSSKEAFPQTKCSACGKEFDFDYVKCPHCKKRR